MELQLFEQELAVVRLNSECEIPSWVYSAEFFSITRTADELSIFCDASVVPSECDHSKGWRIFRVVGQFDLELTGMISALSMPLAMKQISIFSISTHDTDYMVLQNQSLADAKGALERAGHVFV